MASKKKSHRQKQKVRPLRGAPHKFPCGCPTVPSGKNVIQVLRIHDGTRVCARHGFRWKPVISWEIS